MVKSKSSQVAIDPTPGPLFSPRFLVALVLIVGGIAWIIYYYTGVRVDPTKVPAPQSSGPATIAKWQNWNYLIGFGALFVGLTLAAHPSTPLGRGRAVPAAMVACFLIGLLWICTFYVFSLDPSKIPVFNDLGQKNLFVGIGFFAVGFAYATRWE